MNATDDLRRMLDERGVEWEDDSESIYWDGIDGTSWTAERRRAGDLRLYAIGCTPEQAIAATLGRGACKPVISDNLTESDGTGDVWADCSECGHLLFVLTDPNSQPPNYCPNCGRKVVDE